MLRTFFYPTSSEIAISDILLTEDIDHKLRSRFQTTWAGCLGGAISEKDYWQVLKAMQVLEAVHQNTQRCSLCHFFKK